MIPTLPWNYVSDERERRRERESGRERERCIRWRGAPVMKIPMRSVRTWNVGKVVCAGSTNMAIVLP